jgi:hypothetical protein
MGYYLLPLGSIWYAGGKSERLLSDEGFSGRGDCGSGNLLRKALPASSSVRSWGETGMPVDDVLRVGISLVFSKASSRFLRSSIWSAFSFNLSISR